MRLVDTQRGPLQQWMEPASKGSASGLAEGPAAPPDIRLAAAAGGGGSGGSGFRWLRAVGGVMS